MSAWWFQTCFTKARTTLHGESQYLVLLLCNTSACIVLYCCRMVAAGARTPAPSRMACLSAGCILQDTGLRWVPASVEHQLFASLLNAHRIVLTTCRCALMAWAASAECASLRMLSQS